MTYSIEKSRNANLEDTAIPNVFISDYMPDVPDGEYVKVYIYAYMCCCQGVALTHTELAERTGLPVEKVLAAWRYFAGRRLVRISPLTPGDDTHFGVEFVDVKGELYAPGKARGARGGSSAPSSGLADPALAALFSKIAVICGAPAIDGGDAQRIISWLEAGATPELVEYAYEICKNEQNQIRASYVEKPLKEWTARGLRTAADVREYLAQTNARCGVHKSLMEALGLRYSVITPAEEKKFNLWIDEYGYTPARLLELAEKTEGVGNKLKYLGGIIRKEREASGEGGEGQKSVGRGGVRGMNERNEYYRRLRQKNEEEAAVRREEIYAALPAVKAAEEELSLLNMELIKTLTSGMADKKGAVERLNGELAAGMTRRGELLGAAGFPPDYMELRFACPRCKDTGVLENGASCDCYR